MATNATQRPVPSYAPIIVCSICEKRDSGRDGVYVCQGISFCRECAVWVRKRIQRRLRVVRE